MEGPESATRGDLLALESRLVELIQSIRGDLLERVDDIRTQNNSLIADSKNEVLERMEAIETSLLTAFQAWAVPVNSRLRKLEIGDAGLGERLASIEDRLMAPERRPRL